jgi:hypothetical protein
MSPNLPRLLACLAGNRKTVIQQWEEHAMKGIAQDSLLASDRPGDEFYNPVAHVLRTNLPALFDALINDRPREDYCQALDSVVRVRVVQDVPASEAVGFVVALKGILRRAIPDRDGIDPDGGAISLLESRIDTMALQAFDVYMACRERLYEIRLNESRRRTYLAERMAAKLREGAEDTP